MVGEFDTVDFLTDQDMANAISLEVARANNTAPSFRPYIVTPLAEASWVAPAPDHANAIER